MTSPPVSGTTAQSAEHALVAQRQARVLVVAFACNPYKGSEPGVGWGMVRSVAAVAETVVLVSEDDWDDLSRWQERHDDPSLHFVRVDHTRCGRLAMRASRRVHKSIHLAYLTWLAEAGRVAHELHAQLSFDAAVHAAYGSYWLPSPIVDLAVPSVWGPVGGACTTPRSLFRFLGRRGLVGEIWKRMIVRLGGVLPATRRTWHGATIRVAETEATRRALPRAMRSTTRIFNRAPLQRVPTVPRGPRTRTLLFPSALESRKGPRLAIEALAHTAAPARLVFVADGFERRALERLARRLGVDDRVEFHGWVPRHTMFQMMADAAAVVLTGLREEGGCTLSEAMQLGTPVIVLGHGGARGIAEGNTDPTRVAIVDPGAPADVVREIAAAMTRFTENPVERRDSYLDRSATERALHLAIADAIASTATVIDLSNSADPLPAAQRLTPLQASGAAASSGH